MEFRLNIRQDARMQSFNLLIHCDHYPEETTNFHTRDFYLYTDDFSSSGQHINATHISVLNADACGVIRNQRIGRKRS